MYRQTNFINIGQSLYTSTIEILRTYMMHQEYQTDTHCKIFWEGNKKHNTLSKLNGKNSYHLWSILNCLPTKVIILKAITVATRRKGNNWWTMMTPQFYGIVHKWGQCHQKWMVIISSPIIRPVPMHSLSLTSLSELQLLRIIYLFLHHQHRCSRPLLCWCRPIRSRDCWDLWPSKWWSIQWNKGHQLCCLW